MPLMERPGTVALLVALGAGAGCAVPPAPMAPVVATTPSRAASASTPATPEPTPASQAVAPPPTETRTFELLARCTSELAVFPVGDGWLGMCGGEHASGSAFTIDAAGALEAEPTLFRDLPANFALRHARGRSLAELEIAVDTPGLRGADRHFLARRGSTFRPMAAPVDFIQPQYLPPLTVEVGARVLEESHEDGGYVVKDFRRQPGWLPRPSPGESAGCPRRIPQYLAMHADQRGALRGLGVTCDRGLAVERFEVGKPGSTVEMIVSDGGPAAASTLADLRQGGLLTVGDVVVAFASFARQRRDDGYRPDLPPVVARRDAAGWKVLDTAAVGEATIDAAVVAGVDVLLQSGSRVFRVGATAVEPVADGVSRVVAAPDGAAWMTGTSGLLRWRAGALTRIVPQVASAGELAVHGVQHTTDGRALITATPSGARGTVLLRELRAGQAPSAAPPLALEGEDGLLSPFANFYPIDRVPHEAVCEPALVLLYRLSRTTPDDYDFPATRAALRGATRFADIELVELRAVGERHFVAITPDATTALDLVRHITARVPGSKPQAFCEYAFRSSLPVARRLHIDFRTGEVIPPPASP